MEPFKTAIFLLPLTLLSSSASFLPRQKKISMLSKTLLSTLLISLAAGFPTYEDVDSSASSQHVVAGDGHHVHHMHDVKVEKRGGSQKCAFPSGNNLVRVDNTKVAPSEGWAQDGPCTAGSWCQYACSPGYLMAQWDPSVTSYSYPGSQHGGLWCDDNGNLQKRNQGDYCYKGKGTAKAFNSAGKDVAICQTVLPGNEAMLIPTLVGQGSSNDLAVPGPEYWAQTASHFYINPPGVSVEDGCRWGSTANPYGNWSPYVAGFNADSSGNTFAKIGWNPIYFESGSPFKNTNPTFGVRLKCDDESQCNGGSCEINPNTIGLNKVQTGDQQTLADGAAWCVITASGNSGVTLEVFDL